MSRHPPGLFVRRKLKRGSALVAEDADPIPQSAYDELLEAEAAAAHASRNELHAAALGLASLALGGADEDGASQPSRPPVGINTAANTAANTYHSTGNTEPSSSSTPASFQPGEAPPSPALPSNCTAPSPRLQRVRQRGSEGSTDPL
jgi:hypothetical protein